MTRCVFFALLCFVPLHILDAASVTVRQQQAAQNRISQLDGQKQQLQAQVTNNNGQIAKNMFSIAAIVAKMGIRGWGNVTSSGIPTDIEAGLEIASLADDKKRLERQNRELARQNRNIQSQIQAVDSQIAEQNTIINAPTREDLQTDLDNYDESIQRQREYINWQRQRNQPQEDIDDSLWILENDIRRRNDIRNRINEGDYREPLPEQPAVNNQTSSSLPPWFNPTGASVADPSRTDTDIQRASSGSANTQIQISIAPEPQSPVSQYPQPPYPYPPGYRPPHGTDRGGQTPWRPAIPSGGHGSGHSHDSRGRDIDNL